MEKSPSPVRAPAGLSGRLARVLKSEKALTLTVVAGLLGMILILLSSAFPALSSENPSGSEASSPSDETARYKEELTEELGNMISSMAGVGRTKVMVTLEGSVSSVYATDVDVNGRETSRKNGADENADKQNTEKRSCIVLRGKDGSETALAIGSRLPSVKGVLVVCDGADDPSVRDRVKGAVSAALGIGESKVCVSRLAS